MNLPTLRDLVSHGETEQLEFKRSTGQRSEGTRASLLSTIGAESARVPLASVAQRTRTTGRLVRTCGAKRSTYFYEDQRSGRASPTCGL